MIYSMTAFARAQRQSDSGSLTCEIRSINHRYLEISIYLPDILRSLEMPLRELIRKLVKRGKIECGIRYQAASTADNAFFTINTPLAQQICKATEKVAAFLPTAASVSPADVLRFPGVIETKEADVGALQTELQSLVKTTMQELIAARAREGEELKQLFLERMDLLQQELVKVRARLPQVLTDARERLMKRFNDVKLELDPLRLEQEMVIFAQRIDIAEEVDRTETHITEVRRVLQEGGMVGRRLDFLLQELNREANTLGSKSTDSVLTHAAVEMKVLIEQVREQVQNVE